AFYLLAGRAGIGIGTGPSAPYAIDFAGSLVHNLLTYVGWVVDVAMKPSPLRFLDVQDPDVYGMALGGLAVWGIGCLVPGLRARGWVVAGAGFLLLLLPVLPLRNHTYHYFLYAPLMAAAWCLGAAFHMPLAHRRAALSWSVAGVCFLVLAWNGERLVRRMETRPRRVYPALRGHPIVSRSHVARHV